MKNSYLLFYEKNSHQFFGFGYLSNAFNSNADGSTHQGTDSKLAIAVEAAAP
ncbi:hypothetical protein [Nostoc sp. JL33]|nr:hypothetical protein [Nostoc sp. JL33]MBN3871846.1 hypothetical protein [Nostoc sp. JL33]